MFNKFVCAFLILFTSFTFSNTYYLDKDSPNASDSNVGTNPDQPWLTWDKAVNTAQAGDIVIIKKSSSPYIPTTNTTFIHSGNAANRIIFRGENPNDRPIIDYQSNKNFSANNIQFVTWESLKIINTGNGFWTEGSDYLELRRLVIDGVASGSTLRFQGDYNLVEYCEITGSKWNAITIMSHSQNTSDPSDDWRCRGNIIRYNYIHDNTAHHSINIFPYVSPGGSDLMPQYIDSTEIYGNRLENSNWGIYSRYMRYFKIYNNLIVNCTEGGIQLERNYDSGNAGSPDSARFGTYDARGGLIANNTIYNSKGTYGCAIDNRACNNVKFYNNAIWNSASTSDDVQWRFYNPTASSAPPPFNVHPVSNLTIDHNMTSTDGGSVLWNGGGQTPLATWNANNCTNGIIATPQIELTGIDSKWNIAGSYLPQTGSNVIDIGFSALPFNNDYYETQRTQGNGWDIGAAELITGPDLIAPEVIGATFIDPVTIRINFSEPLESGSAQNSGNYSITNGITVLSASLSGSQVTLTTSQHTAGTYTVTINNVTDLSGNIISPDANTAQYEMLGDVTPPEVNSAELIDSVTLRITFSESLDPSTAENISHYNIDPTITVLSADLSNSIVTLSTSVHSVGTYTVTVNNVTDLAGNLISLSANSANYEMVDDSLQGLIQFEIDSATASVIPEPEHSPEQTIDGLGYGDGDPDSRWAGDTMPEWIMFDLGSVKQVSLARLAFYSWETGRIYNYTIRVSTDLNDWVDVLTNVSSAEAEWTENQFNVVDARYIRIVFISSNQNGWAGLWEGQIWGYDDALAVELTEFSAQSNGENVTLNWNTSTELNNAGFEVERRTGEAFLPIGYVNGNGSSVEEHSYSFTDSSIQSGSYYYRLKMIEFGGAYEYSDEVLVDVVSPERFILEQNFPNPFNPSTTIKFSLPQRSNVKLTIYTLLGEKVENLVEQELEAGVHSYEFSPTNLSSGIYLYALESKDFKEIKKLVLLK
ncbi:MAG: discoidin domain-containing protein [Ignavibacteriales bacterium]|nr:discoidin domain-containing protein [Ignavibacteriales bacterium]